MALGMAASKATGTPASALRTLSPSFYKELVRHSAHFPPQQLALVEDICMRGKRLCDPSEGMKNVWADTKRVIPPDEILDVYVAHSIARGDNVRALKKGMKVISKSYEFAYNAFKETELLHLANGRPDKAFRKDGSPLFAHSARLAMVAAHMGAEPNLIAGLLLHDTIEDCNQVGVTLVKLERQFKFTISRLVALLTKPKYEILEDGGHRWIFLANSPKKWMDMGDEARGPEERYSERYALSFTEILNSGAMGITPEMKLSAYVGKWIDGIDSVMTDDHLLLHRREIRVGVLSGERRRLLRITPELDDILLPLLSKRGYALTRVEASPSKTSERVTEVPPITSKDFNCTFFDRYYQPPNGDFRLYSKSDSLRELLKIGRFRESMRLELPHHAPRNSIELIRKFFEGRRLCVSFSPGKSLAPLASSGAGTILMVSGLTNKKQFVAFKDRLEEFHAHLEKLVDGSGIMT